MTAPMANPAATSAAAESIARFQKIVLSWDYLHLVTESKSEGKKRVEGLRRVKSQYKDLDDYLSVFEPLLFEEVKAQILQGCDEEEGGEWQRGAVGSCTENEGFQKVSMAVFDDFREELSENDLLLLSKEKFDVGVKPTAYAFALVEDRGGRETLSLRTYTEGEIAKLNVSKPNNSMRLQRMSSIFNTAESILWILKICSMSTIMREYVALLSLAHLPFKDMILSVVEKPKEISDGEQAWNVPEALMGYLKTNLNDSQIEAIHAGLSRRSFILIQGPPGTGKTQTILGLLSVVLHSAPARKLSNGNYDAWRKKSDLDFEQKFSYWTRASPWILGVNPRDLIMPVDGDDGFFPTGIELKPEILSSNRQYRAHILVCAPSNSALDEIVLRVLKSGIHDENDNVYCPKIVRVGLKPHHSVQSVSMDYLVKQKLSSVDRSLGGGKQGSGGSADRERIRASILDEAAIVFSTLSFSGSSAFGRTNRPFDVVIIDEAAQAVEPATLIPLAHGCRQVFLVGDPVQLPATVISSTATKFGYGTSLFQRFQSAGFPVHMLKVQYRMHPQISIFPSKEFYEGLLQDGEAVDRKRPWHAYSCFGPFCFFDIDGVETQPCGSGSWVNEQEVEFITILYHQLATNYPDLKLGSSVAVISPYRHQVKLLKERFRASFGDQYGQGVDINTVDGFQGREKEVVIFSCVRANEGKGIGFVSDYRRMNVAITRARSAVLVVGSVSTLKQDKHWNNLVESAKERDRLYKVQPPYAVFFSEDNLETMRVSRTQEQQKAQVAASAAWEEGNAAGNQDADAADQADDADVDMDGDGMDAGDD